MIESRRSEINFGVQLLGSLTDSILTDFFGNVDFTGVYSACIDDTHIDRMEIVGTDAASFRLVVPENPDSVIAIAAGEYQDLQIEFRPLRLGTHHAELRIYYDGSLDSVHTIELIGTASNLPIRYGPEPGMIEIDFGKVRPGDSRDSLFTAHNISDSPMQIDAVVSSLPSEMVILTPTPAEMPIMIAPGDSILVQVRFAPAAPAGDRRATVRFQSGGIADSAFVLLGVSAVQTLRAEPVFVDYGTRAAGTAVDTTIRLVNLPIDGLPDGRFIDEVIVDAATIVRGGADFQVRSVPASVPGPGIDTVVVRFTASGRTGPRDGVLRLYFNDRRDSIDVALSGFVEGDLILLSADLGPAITTRPGELIRIPITLTGDLAAAAIDTLDVALRFRRTMLRPTGVWPMGGAEIGEMIDQPDPKPVAGTVVLRVIAKNGVAEGLIGDAEFLVALGDALQTVVTLDSIASPGREDLAVLADSVQIIIDEFCEADARRVRFGGVQAIKATPNPGNGRIVITFNVPALADTRVSLFDGSGREVARLVDGSIEPGEYSVEVDVARLSAGTYYGLLRAGRFVETTSIQIVK